MSDAGKKLGWGLGRKSDAQEEETANPNAECGKPKAQAIAAHSFPQKESEPDSCEERDSWRKKYLCFIPLFEVIDKSSFDFYKSAKL